MFHRIFYGAEDPKSTVARPKIDLLRGETTKNCTPRTFLNKNALKNIAILQATKIWDAHARYPGTFIGTQHKSRVCRHSDFFRESAAYNYTLGGERGRL